MDALFIAAIIGQTKVLATALRTFREFEGGTSECSPAFRPGSIHRWSHIALGVRSGMLPPG